MNASEQNKPNQQERVIPKLRFPEFQTALGWKLDTLGQVLTEPKQIAVQNSQDIELITVKLHCKGIESTGKFPLKTASGRPYYRRFQNEILIGRQNFHNGGIGIVNSDHDGKICSNAISSFNVKSDNLEFVFRYISRETFYKSVISSLGGTGQKEIKKSQLLNLNIFIPSLKEQQKIADCLSSLDELIELQEQKLATLKQHKKGLMQQLFPSHHALQAWSCSLSET
ncbi:restriction endonuclease subunit S [Glaesserella parasuis]|nr:restriction endonuclease subunit S [Glaesserella parasuis]MDO9967016.1 restriction endonuclease subunit S [Glaesserella parasuis]MDO9969238.1 restriction endonuclease subunit S [Glaesserella parasuis]MDO9971398.1 restriction endonuclease subunit S [Glaesserella parasuis]MDP0007391.1 restriction endonuclease subunit S [Glaesserella parasuis]